MHRSFSAVPIACLLVAGVVRAAGMDISFYGSPPDLPAGVPLSVARGVNPGTAVVFDVSRPNQVVLRPASAGELATPTQPQFKFEWLEDKSARFYRLANLSVVAELTAVNERDVSSQEGKRFEQVVLQEYLNQGEVLRACLPPSKPFRGKLSVFIVVSGSGALESALVLPEGSVAECIAERALKNALSSPPAARTFTAKAEIRITE